MTRERLFRLDGEYSDLRQMVRDVCAEGVAPHAARVDEMSEFPAESLAALVAAGIHAIGIPEEFGGQGGDLLASAVVAEEIARVCVSTQQVAGGNELFAWPLLLAGSEELKRRYLAKIASGASLGAFALSEPDAGSDVAALRARANRTETGWRINGTKRWITNAGEAGLYVVFAVTDQDAGPRGISCFVVEAEDAGLTFGALERKMGIKGSPTREVYLENVDIPADRLVGEPGQGLRIALGALDRTRALVAAQAVGLAQGALEVAVGYAQERQQFGKPISTFQGIQFLLADMEIKIRAARLLTYAAAEEAEHGGKEMTIAGAAAKCFASDAAMAVTTDAVQVLGGYGYVKDFPVERMMRDAKITQIYEGTNQIQRIVIARALLAPGHGT